MLLRVDIATKRYFRRIWFVEFFRKIILGVVAEEVEEVAGKLSWH